MIRPSLNDARMLAQGNTLLPLSLELFSDLKTSIEILKAIKTRGQEVYILESVESGAEWGRYTFLGFNPSLTVSGKNNTVTIKRGITTETRPGNPHQIFKEFAAYYKSPHIGYLPYFTGGFVGYFAYEYAKHIEPSLHLTAQDELGLDDFCMMLFDKIIAIDHYRQKIHLIVNISTENLEQNYIDGVAVLKDMEHLVLSTVAEKSPVSSLQSAFEAQFAPEEFYKIVNRAKHYIFEGDIFQCVPSIRFKARYDGDLLPAYRALRTINPSAYMFYIQFGDLQIAGASPETLVSLKNGVVSSFPLAGSCKRMDNDAETERLIEALLQNEKELSEHDMLVDLSRNDLGKICRFGSVNVDEYRKIKRCSHICHISSKVTGLIRDEYDAFDAIAATLPAGTLSGAPKKRAMEIIDELEGVKRNVYGGAVGYIDFSGNMDLCIGIRMAVLKAGWVHVQAGMGVVADSIPENEYQECLNKAGAMMDALKKAPEVQP